MCVKFSIPNLFGLDLETLVSSQLFQTKDTKNAGIARLKREEPKWQWE